MRRYLITVKVNESEQQHKCDQLDFLIPGALETFLLQQLNC